MEVEKISKICFNVLSPDEIRQMSTVPIEYSECFSDNQITIGGLLDTRMGTLEKTKFCQTCNNDIEHCPGHFGHLELCTPVYNVGYISFIVDILKCVCFHCSRVLIDKKKSIEMIHYPSQRIKKIIEQRKPFCNFPSQEFMDINDGCLGEQPFSIKVIESIFIEVKFNNIQHKFSEKSTFRLYPDVCLEIFKRIDPKDFHLIGCDPLTCKPEWMIITVLPVPPPSIRPTNLGNPLSRDENPLTKSLQEIIRINATYKTRLENGRMKPTEIGSYKQLLQLAVAMYMNSKITVNKSSIQQRLGKEKNSIEDRLQGKEGRFRGNILAKRTNSTARAVITPDSHLSLNEVGIPKYISKILTYPERVTQYNINYLTNLVRNGKANFVEKGDYKLNLQHVPDLEHFTLEIGMVVYRHIKNGDFVIMNRQPSLHKFNLMAHKAKIMNGYSFRLNLSVCTPYNADFDGDEMNLYMQQDERTKSETRLMSVENNMITPQSNRPVMGLVQDSLSGSFYMSLRDSFFTKEKVMQMIGFLSSWNGILMKPCILKPVPLWSGKQLLSILLYQFNLERFSGWYPDEERKHSRSELESMDTNEIENSIKKLIIYKNEMNLCKNKKELIDYLMVLEEENFLMTPSDTRVYIDDGELLSGILCKKTLGTSPGSLIHMITLYHGSEKIIQFVDDLQQMVGEFNNQYGISIGLDDMKIPENNHKNIEMILQLANEEIEKWKKQNLTDDELEIKINKMLNDARKKASEDTLKNMSLYSSFKALPLSGAKGSAVNPAQMTRLIGQNNVEGKRIPYSFDDRCLPHCEHGDNSPEGRGFISHSYMAGLTPKEAFFHCCAGREGIIDTAIKTKDIGYLERRVVFGCQDTKVEYDNTVRNSQNEIIQFNYGEDNFDATFMEWQKLEILQLSEEKFIKNYCWTEEELKKYPWWYSNDNNDVMNHWIVREWNRLKKDFSYSSQMESNIPLPVNIKFLLDNIPREFKKKKEKNILTAEQIIKDIFFLQKKCWELLKNESETWNSPFAILIRSYLSSKYISTNYCYITTDGWNWLLEKIYYYYRRSFIHPGECVGTLASQSVGEPATQMTLRTFHFTGQSDKTLIGVPRFKEIINAVVNPKTPSMKIFLNPYVHQNIETVQRIMKKIEFLSFEQVVLSFDIFYDHFSICQTEQQEQTNSLSYSLSQSKNIKKKDQETQYSLPMLSQSTTSTFSTSKNISQTYYNQDKKWLYLFQYFPDEDRSIWFFNERRKKFHNTPSPWTLRIVLNHKLLQSQEVSMQYIVKRLRELFYNTIQIQYNDEYSEPCIIRIQPFMYCSLKSDDDKKYLEELMNTLMKILFLKGIEGIKKTFLKQIPQTKEYYIETDGTNLAGIMAFNEIDRHRTISNDIQETYRLLGVEAARSAIVRELKIILSFDNNYINIRHLLLLSEIMTHDGKIMPITRHGINRRQNYGPLSKCSFEETVDILKNAARFGEKDHIKGVIESIIVGNEPRIGTNMIDIFLDNEKLDQFYKEKNSNQDTNDNDNINLFPTNDTYKDVEMNENDNDNDDIIFIPSSPKRMKII